MEHTRHSCPCHKRDIYLRPFTVCAFKKQAMPSAGLKEHGQGIRSVDVRRNVACWACGWSEY